MKSAPSKAQNGARVVPLRVFATTHGADFSAFRQRTSVSGH
ncbi:hypothetical protein CPter91_3752 [Collimonas pratensis]|uniref:Uncharacterized protein n=1 Tax=Collimonas pratensis TaxID=279113 RepID=A0A127Q7Q9_9BURK|nr:hypothetical protein CPter91_3752 [Collimonas pratensis]